MWWLTAKALLIPLKTASDWAEMCTPLQGVPQQNQGVVGLPVNPPANAVDMAYLQGPANAQSVCVALPSAITAV